MSAAVMTADARSGGRARPVWDGWLLGSTFVLLAAGVVMVYSSSIAYADREMGNSVYFLVRHVCYTILGLLLMAFTMRTRVRWWQKMGPFLLLIGIISLFVVLIPGIGAHVNGSTRWIRLGAVNLQPSEFMKLFTVVYVAGYLVRKQESLRNFTQGIVMISLVVAIIGALLLMEPDMGSLVVIALTVFAMLFLVTRNIILSIIMVSGSRLKQHSDDPEGTKRMGEMILSAVDRGSGLTKQLLTFARKTDIHYEPVDVNEVIQDLIKLLKETFPRMITFELTLQENIPLVSADRNQLNQALLNLCVNARDAMVKGGILEIRTVLDEGTKLRDVRPDAPPGQYVTITASDTGTGMDLATRERIFEPFFTTKERGHGTGLGLAVVYGVVKGHNGFIHVESTMGLGTSFHLFFPVIPVEAVGALPVFEDVDDVEGGNETILFVEDEEALKSVMEQILESKGYKVLGAHDGQEAVEIFRKKNKETDVVVMDLELPLLNGLDALMQMHKLNKKPKLLVASGYFDPGVKSKLQKLGVKIFVQKPYSPATLLRRIRDVISAD